MNEEKLKAFFEAIVAALRAHPYGVDYGLTVLWQKPDVKRAYDALYDNIWGEEIPDIDRAVRGLVADAAGQVRAERFRA